jgi:hypothetical protein
MEAPLTYLVLSILYSKRSFLFSYMISTSIYLHHRKNQEKGLLSSLIVFDIHFTVQSARGGGGWRSNRVGKESHALGSIVGLGSIYTLYHQQTLVSLSLPHRENK